MVLFEDNRTPQERERDFRDSEKRRFNAKLSLGMLEVLRGRLEKENMKVGIVEPDFCSAKLLFVYDNVKYSLKCSAIDD